MRLFARNLMLILLLVMATGFAAHAQQDSAPDLVLVGKAEMVGTGNFPILLFTSEDGKKYSLGGPWLDELKNIERIKIRIWAVLDGKKQDHEHLSVLRYEILDVGKGVKPFVGTIVVDGDKVMLKLVDSPVVYTLTGNSKILEMLKAAAGGRVWISGITAKGDLLKIKKFGILSKPKG